MGHTSQEEKNQLLGKLTRQNINAVHQRLAKEDGERQQDLVKANEYIRQEHDELVRVQQIMDQMQ